MAPRKKVLKKPSARYAKKEEPEDDEEEDEEEEDEEEEETSKPKSDAQSASAAKREMMKKRRLVAKLNAVKETLRKKMLANNTAIRAAEKDLEEAEAVARKWSRKVNGAKSKKLAEMAEKKLQRALKGRAAADKKIRSMRKRMNGNKKFGSLKDKLDDAKQIRDIAQSRLSDAEKRCKDLKAKGEDIPTDGEIARDLSAPGAWKPPGFLAAKSRSEAKKALAKAQASYDKVFASYSVFDNKRKAVKEAIEHVKLKRKETEDMLSQLPKKRRAKGRCTGSTRKKAKAKR